MAVNETRPPLHIGLAPLLIETETVAGADELTVSTMALLVAPEGTGHTVLEVITQVMDAGLGRLVAVKVGLLPPLMAPFIFH